MKKILKIAIAFIVIITCLFVPITEANSIWDIGKEFLDIGANVNETIMDSELGRFDKTKAINGFVRIIDFLLGIGLMVVFVVTIVLGMRYMSVSPNEKSRIKQATTPYIIGTVIVFGAVTIWRIVIQILEGSMLGG